jgi:hypothetical protein
MHCTKNSKQLFPEMKLSGLVPKFLHSCICERFIFSHDRFAVLRLRNERSQIHECRNWERGCAVSFLGIFGKVHLQCGGYKMLMM